MKSILQEEKECFVCGRTGLLHCHHVFGGTANRKLSEKYGLKITLCMEHHTGAHGIHFHKPLDNQVKKMAQKRFEEVYPDINFRDVFGKNYL